MLCDQQHSPILLDKILILCTCTIYISSKVIKIFFSAYRFNFFLCLFFLCFWIGTTWRLYTGARVYKIDSRFHFTCFTAENKRYSFYLYHKTMISTLSLIITGKYTDILKKRRTNKLKLKSSQFIKVSFLIIIQQL